ncbi:MAG: methylmalonyl-CoA mutase [Deltaproteobacteria bacterium]|nr:methylmalonyl-CoA mutase [Deltaproteobacteria bacterium]
MTKKKAHILMAKPGLDGHDRGGETVAHALREAGLQVSYTRLHKTPKEIVKQAMDNNVDVIGLSVLSGAHIPICTEMVEEMKAADIVDKPLMVGGVIPERDVETLRQLGVGGVFPVDSPYDDIIDFVRNKTDAG